MTYGIVSAIICVNLRFIIHYDTPSADNRLGILLFFRNGFTWRYSKILFVFLTEVF